MKSYYRVNHGNWRLGLKNGVVFDYKQGEIVVVDDSETMKAYPVKVSLAGGSISKVTEEDYLNWKEPSRKERIEAEKAAKVKAEKVAAAKAAGDKAPELEPESEGEEEAPADAPVAPPVPDSIPGHRRGKRK